jgi:type III pantothenate kinase
MLPEAGGTYADFAADTGDALASGCEGAALALVAQSLDAAAARLRQAPLLLLHGGGAASLAMRLPGAVDAPALVLEGLAQWPRVAA